MDQDPCIGTVGWSVLAGAVGDSTLAGVLAGFLIAAATALLVQGNDGSDPDTFALFASGVPVLTLSSFLFTVLSGTKSDSARCDQAWSQWLPAFTMLLIGASVLLCGLGWALVSYGDNLAVKQIQKNRPMQRVHDHRRFFISLSACLSLTGTTAMTCWLIAANVVYLKGTRPTRYPFVEFLQVKWHPMFFVFFFGLYVVVRSAYVVLWRTRTALRENVASCAGYVPGNFPPLPIADGVGDKLAERMTKEICFTVGIALDALLAEYLTNHATDERFSAATSCRVVGVLVVGYVIARLAYRAVVRLFGPALGKARTTESFAEADAMILRTPTTQVPEDAIRIKYVLRRLSATSYHVVVFAVLGTLFAWALPQGSLGPWRAGLSLLIGGLYPAGILLGLSYAVPASQAAKLPEWKTWRWLRLLP
jgi:hypothetical protein